MRASGVLCKKHYRCGTRKDNNIILSFFKVVAFHLLPYIALCLVFMLCASVMCTRLQYSQCNNPKLVPLVFALPHRSNQEVPTADDAAESKRSNLI